MNMPKPKDKPFAIPKQLVWEAYQRVAANKGAPGVDGQALDEFEADLRDNLYVISEHSADRSRTRRPSLPASSLQQKTHTRIRLGT